MKTFIHLLQHPEDLSTPAAFVLMAGIEGITLLMFVWSI